MRKQLENRRRQGYLLIGLMVLSTFFPGAVASAQILFARPGAGVSSLPLNIVAFSAPGFGTIQDAINLVNGNVYVAMDSMARNNLPNGANESYGDDQWQFLPVMQLLGFNSVANHQVAIMLPLLSGAFSPVMVNSSAVPQTFTLRQGDGSDFTFQRQTTIPADSPSWIQRYSAQLNSAVYAYRLMGQAGVQYSQEWLIYRPGGSQGSIAHYYTQDGNRYTFHRDGDYVDYSQNRYQQYRSAAANPSDPDGIQSNSPKTEFTYAGTPTSNPSQMGQLTKVKDEFGRVTTYEWHTDGGRRYITRINFLLQNEADNSTFTRRVAFTYADLGTPRTHRVISQITYTGADGVGGTATRWVRFQYSVSGSRLLLTRIQRQVIGAASSVDTIYTYNSAGRIIRVALSDQPSSHHMHYIYGTNTVIAAQGNTAQCHSDLTYKCTTYTFNASGQLLSTAVRDHNPDITTNPTHIRTWTYTYYTEAAKQGSTRTVTDPAGKVTTYDYDTQGNITLLRVQGGSVSREQTFTYDNDNRITEARLKGPTSASDVVTTYSYGLYSSGQVRAVNTVTETVQVGTTNQYTVTSTFDDIGRLTQTRRQGEGQTLTTNYAYHAGGTWAPFLPITSDSATLGNISGTRAPAARQYADLVSSMSVSGLTTTSYNYDALGHVAEATVTNFHASDVSTGSAPTLGRLRTLYSYNGFGQPVWTHVQQSATSSSAWVQLSKAMTTYHPTGEVRHSWSGDPRNATVYTYFTSGVNLGRVATMTKGVSANSDGQIATGDRREHTVFSYDSHGRVVGQQVDGFTTNYAYDTLDRVTKETRPPEHGSGTRGVTTYAYDATGQVREVNLPGIGATTTTRDALGRATQIRYPDNTTVVTTYDAYDRPIIIVDNRLTMLSSADRTRVLQYDALGNLIKELGPVMASSYPTLYTDARRPYSEYTYDKLGRLTQTRTLVNASTPVATNDLQFPSGATIATTQFTYDSYDRVTKQVDPLGYETTYAYDGAGNRHRVTQQVWKTTEPDYSTASSGFTSIASHTAYDALGRPIKTIDPRGHIFRTTYDIHGNVRQSHQPDQSGSEYIRYDYLYTPDGLLQSVREPSLSGSGLVTTKFYSYAQRKFPTALRVAHETVTASATTGSLTSYSYDWAGRPVLTTLPVTQDQNGNNVNATITQRYDTRGNLLTLIDANGFTTNYSYDALNRVISETKPRRTSGTGKTIDEAAFPGVPSLTTTYSYDPAGNLLEENHSGLMTKYRYNSLGQVIAQTRPHTSNVTSPLWKLTTYRLDGQITATSSFDYAGGIRGSTHTTIAGLTADYSSSLVAQGNLTGYTRNVRGEVTKEVSRGAEIYFDGTYGNVYQEHSIQTLYNGLGQRYRRDFSGSPNVYAIQFRSGGTSTGLPNYFTFWKYDRNGNLTESWDRVVSDNQNQFSYTYTPTNQQATSSQNIQLRRPSPDPNPHSSNPFFNPPRVAGTIATTTATYNRRDLVTLTVVTEQTPYRHTGYLPALTTETTTSYFQSGLPYQVITEEAQKSAIQTYKYDTRNREMERRDSNGMTTHRFSVNPDTDTPSFSHTALTDNRGVIKVATYYGADGTKVERVIQDSNSACRGVTTVPTLGGRTYQSVEYNWRASNCSFTESNVSNRQTVAYSATGLPATTVSQRRDWNENQMYTSTTSHTYEAGYRLLTQTSTETTSSASGSTPVSTTNTYNYTNNGDLRREVLDGIQKRYTLDSKGNRLALNGTYWLKRYDAAGLPRYYHRESQDQGWLGITYYQTHMTFFLHDPFGNQVLGAQVGLKAQGSGTHTLNRTQVSRSAIGGVVQTLRHQSVRYGSTCGAFGCETYGMNHHDRFQSHAFSLADGLRGESWSVFRVLRPHHPHNHPLRRPQQRAE